MTNLTRVGRAGHGRHGGLPPLRGCPKGGGFSPLCALGPMMSALILSSFDFVESLISYQEERTNNATAARQKKKIRLSSCGFTEKLYFCGVVLPYSVGNAKLSTSMFLTVTINISRSSYFGFFVRSNAVNSQFFVFPLSFWMATTKRNSLLSKTF